MGVPGAQGGSGHSDGTREQAACELAYVVVESRFQTKKDNSHFEWAFRHSKSICGVNVFAAVLPGLGTASLGPLGLSEAILAHPYNFDVFP